MSDRISRGQLWRCRTCASIIGIGTFGTGRGCECPKNTDANSFCPGLVMMVGMEKCENKQGST